MKSEPVLEAVNVVMELGSGAGKVMALKGVSVALRPSELTLLMGPSGSGKTTLLSILGCILKPTSGDIRVVGQSTIGKSAEELATIRRDHIGGQRQRRQNARLHGAVGDVRGKVGHTLRLHCWLGSGVEIVRPPILAPLHAASFRTETDSRRPREPRLVDACGKGAACQRRVIRRISAGTGRA